MVYRTQVALTITLTHQPSAQLSVASLHATAISRNLAAAHTHAWPAEVDTVHIATALDRAPCVRPTLRNCSSGPGDGSCSAQRPLNPRFKCSISLSTLPAQAHTMAAAPDCLERSLLVRPVTCCRCPKLAIVRGTVPGRHPADSCGTSDQDAVGMVAGVCIDAHVDARTRRQPAVKVSSLLDVPAARVHCTVRVLTVAVFAAPCCS